MAKRKPKPKAETEAPEPPPPLILETTPEFKRGLKRMEKRGKRLEKLHAVIELLQTRQPLPRSQQDHALAGDRKGGETATSSRTGSSSTRPRAVY